MGNGGLSCSARGSPTGFGPARGTPEPVCLVPFAVAALDQFDLAAQGADLGPGVTNVLVDGIRLCFQAVGLGKFFLVRLGVTPAGSAGAPEGRVPDFLGLILQIIRF